MTDTEYPTWKQISPTHWETEEQMDGTPDYIATRTNDKEGWRLKWRSSAQAIVGFRRMSEVIEFVRQQEADMVKDAAERKAWIEEHRAEFEIAPVLATIQGVEAANAAADGRA